MKITILSQLMLGLLTFAYARADYRSQELKCTNGAYSFSSELGPLHTAGTIELYG